MYIPVFFVANVFVANKEDKFSFFISGEWHVKSSVLGLFVKKTNFIVYLFNVYICLILWCDSAKFSVSENNH